MSNFKLKILYINWLYENWYANFKFQFISETSKFYNGSQSMFQIVFG